MADLHGPLDGDALLDAVTEAMSALHQRYYHRAPGTTTSRMMGPDLLACVLGGVYTDGRSRPGFDFAARRVPSRKRSAPQAVCRRSKSLRCAATDQWSPQAAGALVDRSSRFPGHVVVCHPVLSSDGSRPRREQALYRCLFV